MKIYTKILIGMVVGIVVGFALGPNSALFEHDLLLVRDPGTFKLLDRPAGTPIGVQVPPLAKNRQAKGPATRMTLLEQRHAGRELFFKVTFRVTQRLALRDDQGRLKPGQWITGWVASTAVPRPVSRIGAALSAVFDPIGRLFLKLIKMVIVPLVFASLLVGVASLGDIRKLGRLGGKTLGYFLATTVVAITIGLRLANIRRPGDFISPGDKRELEARYSAEASSRAQSAAEQPGAVDNLLAIVPENPIRSMSSGDMLQIIFFAAFLGIALTLVPQERAQPVIAVFEAINDAMIVIVDIIMKFAPYGVLALVAQVVGQSGLSVLKALLVYARVVMGGLVLHTVLTYTSVVRFFGKIHPVDFWRAARPAQLIAFSTSSSSATLPVTMECAERNLGVSNQVSSFVLPLGSTVNMDGTALYQGVAAVFIAQVFNMHLSLGDQLSIVLTATLASIGAAGVPGVGMITLALVLTSIGVPTVGVALILGVDRILDMFRTAVNVTGDMSATVMVAATEGEQLSYRDPTSAADRL